MPHHVGKDNKLNIDFNVNIVSSNDYGNSASFTLKEEDTDNIFSGFNNFSSLLTCSKR